MCWKMPEKKKSKLPHIYANAAQAVFRVWYSDIDTLASEIVLEDANEGEKDRKGIEKSGVIRYSKNVVFHK